MGKKLKKKNIRHGLHGLTQYELAKTIDRIQEAERLKAVELDSSYAAIVCFLKVLSTRSFSLKKELMAKSSLKNRL